MNDDAVVVSRQPGCCTLTLNRARKANALSAQMMLRIGSAVSATGDGDLIVLRSASTALFCAGADIAEFAAGEERLAAQEHALLEMIARMAHGASPLIALARGRASGAGVILLCLADVVIAADDLQLSCPEIRFGMYPIIVEAVLQSRISLALAAQMCVAGQSFDAQAAHRIGLVSDVLPGADFEQAAGQRLGFYLERRSALHIARRSRLSSQPPEMLVERVRAVAPLMAENFRSPGVRDGILEYLEGLRRRA